MDIPNAAQATLADLPIGNVLALAPAGCGKTEALAYRAGRLVARRDVTLPRMVLALTFTNKARDNLVNRLARVVGRGWRQRVTAANFHGLAARIVRAHGGVIGVAPDVCLPDEPWRRRTRRELGISSRNAEPFETALRNAKNGPYDDDAVMSHLMATGHNAAIEYEQRLRADRRLDHDDLLRHLARLLAVAAVRRLYRVHFGAVLVDEVQDLSLLQFEILRGIGGDTVTYAGDPAQGIYGFAGADPEAVFASIRALDPEVVELTVSYRSTPNVLRAVNALTSAIGASALSCGAPLRWPDAGHVIYLERANPEAEAAALLSHLRSLLSAKPDTSIGVISRRVARLMDIKTAAGDADVPFLDWSLPTHVPDVVRLLRRFVREATAGQGSQADQLRELERHCRTAMDPADAEMSDALTSACSDLYDLIEDGVSLGEAVAGCRTPSSTDSVVGAGLHLLSGHKGKGQEFDWVVVVGLEEGHVPDFRNPNDPEELRVLHVMTSRARYGLFLTYSRSTRTQYGWRPGPPSRWLTLLRDAATETDIE